MTSRKHDSSPIFISYSRSDAKWLKRLHVHLKPLEREYGIAVWDDTNIRPGAKWREEIEGALSSARVAILLVSADFLASDFITTNELPYLLHAAAEKGTVILPIIVSPSRFSQTPALAQFQTVNNPSKPLIRLSRAAQEDTFAKVARAIEDLLSNSPEVISTRPEEYEPELLNKKWGVKKNRRIDAAVPSHAAVNEHIDLLVQVRLPDSPLLGVDDWPNRQKPSSVKQTAAERDLEFPIDRRTGELGSARLEIRLVAPDFEIRGTARKFVDVPPDRPSELIKFLITAKRSGTCKIDVEVYKADETYLGTIPLETSVDGVPAVAPPSIANLVLVVVVKHDAGEFLEKGIEESRVEDAKPPPRRTLVETVTSLLKNNGIAPALIATIGALIVGYWQFVYKPTHSDEIVKYAGRLMDSSTQKVIGGAKITVDLKQGPQVYYTDSEGVFYLEVPRSIDTVRLRVEAEGYAPFDRNVLIFRTGVEEIRLERIKTEPSPENIGLTFGHNPSLDEVRSTLEQVRHLNISFNSTCDKSVRRAVVRLNGGQLDGKDVKDLLENAAGPRANVKLSVKPIKEGESYEIICNK